MKYFAVEPEAVLEDLDVDLEQGLNEQSVSARLEEHGTNELQHARRRGGWRILWQQFKSVDIIILAVAGAAALATAQWVEVIAIAVVVVVNTVIGFITEYKAVRSMEALREMGGHKATVRRGGQQQQVDVRELVPGDAVGVHIRMQSTVSRAVYMRTTAKDRLRKGDFHPCVSPILSPSIQESQLSFAK